MSIDISSITADQAQKALVEFDGAIALYDHVINSERDATDEDKENARREKDELVVLTAFVRRRYEELLTPSSPPEPISSPETPEPAPAAVDPITPPIDPEKIKEEIGEKNREKLEEALQKLRVELDEKQKKIWEEFEQIWRKSSEDTSELSALWEILRNIVVGSDFPASSSTEEIEKLLKIMRTRRSGETQEDLEGIEEVVEVHNEAGLEEGEEDPTGEPAEPVGLPETQPPQNEIIFDTTEELPSEYMTFQEALDVLKIDEEELLRLISNAELKAWRLEGQALLKRGDVMNLVDGPSIILTDSEEDAEAETVDRETSGGEIADEGLDAVDAVELDDEDSKFIKKGKAHGLKVKKIIALSKKHKANVEDESEPLDSCHEEIETLYHFQDVIVKILRNMKNRYLYDLKRVKKIHTLLFKYNEALKSKVNLPNKVKDHGNVLSILMAEIEASIDIIKAIDKSGKFKEGWKEAVLSKKNSQILELFSYMLSEIEAGFGLGAGTRKYRARRIDELGERLLTEHGTDSAVQMPKKD